MKRSVGLVSVLVVLGITSTLISAFSPLAAAQSNNWVGWASNAWKYFAPQPNPNPNNIGCLSSIGLCRATRAWDRFTDWDLGSYIFAIIFADKLGINTDPTWTFSVRAQKVVDFLLSRDLDSSAGNIPWWDYQYTTGLSCHQLGETSATCPHTDLGDSGRFLLSLWYLREHIALKNPGDPLIAKINSVFARSKAAYDSMSSTLSPQFGIVNSHSLYLGRGFAAWGYNMTNQWLNFLNTVNGLQVTINYTAVQWPKSIDAFSETLLLGSLEINLDGPNGAFRDLAQRIYLAQQQRYLATGNLTAWTEGQRIPTGSCTPDFAYQLVYHAVTGNSWVIRTPTFQIVTSVCQPYMQTRAAFGLHALFNSAYTQQLVNAALKTDSGCCGYMDATDEKGNLFPWDYGQQVAMTLLNTNGMIITGAAHVLDPPAPLPLSSISNTVFGSSANSAFFVIPDYDGPLHTAATKCSGVFNAALSDFTGMGVLLGMLKNTQNQVLDTEAAFINQAAPVCGQPNTAAVTGGVVATGGPLANAVVHYYETIEQDTPVYYSFTVEPSNGSRIDQFKNRNGQIVAQLSRDLINTGNTDLFVVEAFTDANGRSIYLFYGFAWKGSFASASYLKFLMNPTMTSFTSSYYVYRWIDATSGPSANGLPDAGDTYVLQSSG